MIPDIIVILSGGTIKVTNEAGETIYISTTYEHRDAFGVLGGIARVQAGAIIAKQFPEALVMTTSHRVPNDPPTHAFVMAHELEDMGVNKNRIILEENSTNSKSQIMEVMNIAVARKFTNVLFVTNEYHIQRVKTLYEYLNKSQMWSDGIKIDFISAEAVMSSADEKFVSYFDKVKNTDAYKERLISEKRGVEMILSGSYEDIKDMNAKKETMVDEK